MSNLLPWSTLGPLLGPLGPETFITKHSCLAYLACKPPGQSTFCLLRGFALSGWGDLTSTARFPWSEPRASGLWSIFGPFQRCSRRTWTTLVHVSRLFHTVWRTVWTMPVDIVADAP